MEPTPLLPYLWMLGGALAFATMGATAHALGETYDWQLIAAVRSFVPLVLMFCLAQAGGVRLVFWRPGTLWWRSMAGSASLVLTFYALTRLPIADVLTLTNLFPLWIALISWPLFRVAPSAGVWGAIGIGLVGVVLVQQPHVAQGNLAVFTALASSLFSALALLSLHRLHRLDARAIVFHFSLVAFLTSLFCLAVDRPSSLAAVWQGRHLPLFVLLGVSATLGQWLLTKAFTHGDPARVSVVGLSQVGFGVVYDLIFWHRSLHALTVVGMILVLTPTAWLLLHAGRRRVVVSAARDAV